TAAQAYTVSAKMQWWYAARFGMFIHFGSYSYLGRGEWVMNNENWSKANYHAQVTANFNPASFNAATVVGLARAAGMRYLVITAKHHEGFSMWDTAVAGFRGSDGRGYDLPGYTAYRGDLLGALKAECDRQGIRFCLYYSILDWSHPSQTRRSDALTTMSSMTARANYIADMKAQLRELLDRYDPAVLWFDGDWGPDPATPTLTDWWTAADGRDLYNYLVGLKPTLVINERVKRGTGLGDYLCPEESVPATPPARPWETCRTMNGAWGYNAGLEGSYKSVRTLLQELVRVVSRDGNYLLNVGPRGDGVVTAPAVAVLNGMGAWLRTHGDSIYGATGSPFSAEPTWGYFTKKSGRLYAHVLSWPTGGRLQIPALQNTINRIHLLNNPGTALSYTVSGGTITVTVPATAPNPDVSVVVLEVVGVPTPGAGGGGLVSGGVYKLVGAGGGVLDNANSGTDGTSVVQWTDNGGTPQRWTLTAVGGYYKLVCARSGKALDNGSTATDGAPAMQWTDNGGAAQQWSLTATGGGTYKLVSRHSGKALDTGGATTNGAAVVQRTDSGATTQRWQFVRLS
ncbi:MAG TPA: alpha-L-fucosidase, partial [Catenuloplanes sp.]